MWKEIEARVRELLQNDDREAIVLLHQHFYKEMLHSGLRICLDKDLVKDTIQDVLIGVWTSRHTVDRIESLKGYLLVRSEEHTSELQSLMRISYAVFCLKKKTNTCY